MPDKNIPRLTNPITGSAGTHSLTNLIECISTSASGLFEITAQPEQRLVSVYIMDSASLWLTEREQQDDEFLQLAGRAVSQSTKGGARASIIGESLHVLSTSKQHSRT